jgi:hypothetical protein
MFLPQNAFKPLAEDPQGTALVRAPIWPSVHHRLSDKKYAKMVNKMCHVIYQRGRRGRSPRAFFTF